MSSLKKSRVFLVIVLAVCFASLAVAQDTSSEQTQAPPESTLVTKTVRAVGYEVGGGSTKVDLKPTDVMPTATGEAKVEIKSKAGRANVEVNVKGLKPPSTLGAEFLTYVVWVVTPEGRTGNTGELLINKNGEGKLSATTPAQAFSVVVTAEPYFAVRLPSEMLILISDMRKDTKGKIFPVSEYKLVRRAQYEKMGNPLALTLDPSIPLDVYEARNAVEVAKSRGAEKYAPEIFSKAEGGLQITERSLATKGDPKETISRARQTAQFAEDARALATLRQEQERIENEKRAAAAAAAAHAKQEAESKAAAEAAEAQRIADEKAAEAKRLADAEIEAKEAARRKEEEQRKQAELEKQQLRAKLLEQFNRVLPTTDSSRGLVVNMGDVLFDTGKADLRTDAREALAKLSGIVLNYPSLRLAIEGYTDSTGTEEFNQTLSEKRAGSVYDYLMKQGLKEDTLSSKGFGWNSPVADNKTTEGRQKNRRVEIVVSGEVIGTDITAGK
jgi:outer membrane protein OmpA-like peptidoglycan-associated protein